MTASSCGPSHASPLMCTEPEVGDCTAKRTHATHHVQQGTFAAALTGPSNILMVGLSKDRLIPSITRVTGPSALAYSCTISLSCRLMSVVVVIVLVGLVSAIVSVWESIFTAKFPMDRVSFQQAHQLVSHQRQRDDDDDAGKYLVHGAEAARILYQLAQAFAGIDVFSHGNISPHDRDTDDDSVSNTRHGHGQHGFLYALPRCGTQVTGADVIALRHGLYGIAHHGATRYTTAPMNRKAIFITSPMPSHMTRMGNKATTGAERKGSISGDSKAFKRGAAPIMTPTGMPMAITSRPAANTRPADHRVALNNMLLPSFHDK